MTRQITIRPVTYNSIMLRAAFRLGMKDAHEGRFDPDRKEVRSDTDKQWSYERGWQFARLSGKKDIAKINARRVAPDNIRLFAGYSTVLRKDGTLQYGDIL